MVWYIIAENRAYVSGCRALYFPCLTSIVPVPDLYKSEYNGKAISEPQIEPSNDRDL